MIEVVYTTITHPSVWAALLLCLTFSWAFYSYVNRGLPPGPHGWPWFGYTNCFGDEAFDKIQHLKVVYGDVVSFRFLGRLLVILNTPDTIHEAAVQNRSKIGRYTMCVNGLLAKNTGISNYDTKRAVQLRQALLRHMYGGENKEQLTNIHDFVKGKFFEQEVEKLMNQLKIRQGKPIKILPLFRRTIWSIMWNFVVGGKCKLQSKEIDTITNNISLNNSENLLFQERQLLPKFCVKLWEYLPWMRQLFGIEQIMERHKVTNALLQEQISEVLRESESDSLIHRLANDERLALEESELKRLMYELLAASTDTTSLTLAWACDYLARCQQEGRVLLNSRQLDMIHRWASVVPFALPHIARDEFEMRTYRIPKGSIVIFNLYSVHNSQLKQLTSTDVPQLQIRETDKPIPFSLGSRSCPGNRLANEILLPILNAINERFLIQPVLLSPFEKISAASHRSLSPCGLTRIPHKTTFTFVSRVNMDRKTSS